MRRNTKKKRAFVLLMMVVLLWPMRSVAQYREERYGLQPWFGQQSLMNREGTGGNSYGINGQEFGSTPTGGIGVGEFGSTPTGGIGVGEFGSTPTGGIGVGEFGSTPTGGIGVEEFGSPLGSGVLILLAAGAGYATLKRKKNESTTENN